MHDGNIPVTMFEIEEYLDERGRSPFARWLEDIDKVAAARVTIAVTRIAKGNLSNARPVGQGVSEYRLHFGPGYRIYFAMMGATLIVLLGGGSKRGQRRDIEEAQRLWADYKRRAGRGE